MTPKLVFIFISLIVTVKTAPPFDILGESAKDSSIQLYSRSSKNKSPPPDNDGYYHYEIVKRGIQPDEIAQQGQIEKGNTRGSTKDTPIQLNSRSSKNKNLPPDNDGYYHYQIVKRGVQPEEIAQQGQIEKVNTRGSIIDAPIQLNSRTFNDKNKPEVKDENYYYQIVKRDLQLDTITQQKEVNNGNQKTKIKNSSTVPMNKRDQKSNKSTKLYRRLPKETVLFRRDKELDKREQKRQLNRRLPKETVLFRRNEELDKREQKEQLNRRLPKETVLFRRNEELDKREQKRQLNRRLPKETVLFRRDKELDKREQKEQLNRRLPKDVLYRKDKSLEKLDQTEQVNRRVPKDVLYKRDDLLEKSEQTEQVNRRIPKDVLYKRDDLLEKNEQTEQVNRRVPKDVLYKRDEKGILILEKGDQIEQLSKRFPTYKVYLLKRDDELFQSLKSRDIVNNKEGNNQFESKQIKRRSLTDIIASINPLALMNNVLFLRNK